MIRRHFAAVFGLIDRRTTLYIVSLLCVLQFIGTLLRERDAMDGWMLVATGLAIVVFLSLFEVLYRSGHRLARRAQRHRS